MRIGTLLGLSAALSLVVIAQACSSSTDAAKPLGADASTEGGGAGGTDAGQKATGGKASGTGGKASGGAAASGKCDKTSCQAQIVTILDNLGAASPADGGAGPVTACCLTDTKCGVDMTTIAALVSTLPSGCTDPSTLADSGFNLSGMTYPVLPNGFIAIPPNPPIEIDPSCAGVVIANPILPVKLPGCCLPSGKCGGSTHKLPSLIKAPLGCESTADVTTFAKGSSLGSFLTVSPDPNKSCTYQPTGITDAGSGG
jgi:hypothetical protein